MKTELVMAQVPKGVINQSTKEPELAKFWAARMTLENLCVCVYAYICICAWCTEGGQLLRVIVTLQIRKRTHWGQGRVPKINQPKKKREEGSWC